ncbi:hypothetical protein [Gilvibacter sediminis]|uniref:hypothetical protein n=1 Tax=Gilvibacter sediminis TaxID=379071 RepID=UPI0023504715|nr:hypothetical protein [Gilvibacter sediminis]MDC7998132.1 hypothetical protein [Gilvibacter sediminis]
MAQAEYPNYPELIALKSFVEKYDIQVSLLSDAAAIIPEHSSVSFSMANKPITLYLDDEYGDLQIDNPLLHIACCLDHLEIVEESEDYLQWCREHGYNTGASHLLNHYKSLVAYNDSIRSCFRNQKIESFVNSLDFQLNQRAAQALRAKDFTL